MYFEIYVKYVLKSYFSIKKQGQKLLRKNYLLNYKQINLLDINVR